MKAPLMIAAGSLFTSCVTNTEPQGVKDLREAKADYLASLARLRDADAALQKANAAYRDAETALKNAELQLKEITIAVEQAKGDAAIAKAKQEAELAAVKAKEELARAEATLQETLRNIAVESKNLTEPEKKAITAYTSAYQDYITALNTVREAEKQVYDDTLSLEEAILKAQVDSAVQLANIEYYTEALASLPDSGQGEEIVKEKIHNWLQQKIEVDYAIANLDKEWNLYNSTTFQDNIEGFTTDLISWIVKNVALPAPFIMNYKVQLPDNPQVFHLLKTSWDNIGGTPNSGRGGDGIVYEYLNKVEFAEDAEGKFWLIANFNNAPMARRWLFGRNNEKSIANLLEALGRDQVVDPATWHDTTGMAAAVKAAKEDYAKTEAALKAGIEADADVNAAKEVYNTKKEALAPAKDEYDSAKADFEADTDALFAAVDSFVGTWNRVANTTRTPNPMFPLITVTGQLNSQDSLDIFNALVDVIKARKEVFPNPDDKQFYYYYTQKVTPGFYPGRYTYEAVENSVEIDPDSLKFSGIQRNRFNQSLYGGQLVESSAPGQPLVTWENANELGWLLAAAFEGFETLDKEGFSEKFFGKEGLINQNPPTYPFAPTTVTINPIEKGEFVAALSGTAVHDNLRNLFFDKYAYKSAANAIVEVKTQELYIRPDVQDAIDEYNDAVAAANTANDDLCEAIFEGYYCGVYGKYWGLTAGDLEGSLFDVTGISSISREISSGISMPAGPSFDIDDQLDDPKEGPYAQFQDPADSLHIVFDLATFTDPNKETIVEFDFNNGDYFKDGAFYYKGKDIDDCGDSVEAEDNYQLEVISKILLANETFYSNYADKVNPGKMLIAKVIYKQELQKAYTSTLGTESVEEALETLAQISKNLVNVYDDAIAKRAESSQAFFDFINGLFGKECIDYVIEGFDRSLAKAAEIIPQYVMKPTKGYQFNPLFEVLLQLVDDVRSGKLTGKHALIEAFENLMCGEYTYFFESYVNGDFATLADNMGGADAVVAISNFSSAFTDMVLYKNNPKSQEVYDNYTIAYMALQIGDAFSGEGFRTLLADVINSYIKDIFKIADIPGVIDPIKEYFDENNIKDLSDVVEAVVALFASDPKETLIASLGVRMFTGVSKYFGGEIAELNKKYFAEWTEKKNAYESAIAVYNKKKEVLQTSADLYNDYLDGIKTLIDVEEYLKKALETAETTYKEDCKVLAAIAAGADASVILYKANNDKLNKAKLALEIAEQRLAQAKKAYDQVLANHKND